MQEMQNIDAVNIEKDTDLTCLIIVGNQNVGKSTLFNRLSSTNTSSITVDGSDMQIETGTISSTGQSIIDTPGTYSLFLENEDAIVTRKIILQKVSEGVKCGLVFVADAKNMRRSLSALLQFTEYGLPMIVAANMSDEAEARGIVLDYDKLSSILGIDVCPTVARSRVGISGFLKKLPKMRVPMKPVDYAGNIEKIVRQVRKELNPQDISARIVTLLALAKDSGMNAYIKTKFDAGKSLVVNGIISSARKQNKGNLEVQLSDAYNTKAGKILDEIQSRSASSRKPILDKIGTWCMQLTTGIPLAIIALYLLYNFIGSFGATYLVDTINGTFFEGFLIPIVTDWVQIIPSEFIRDMIIDPDFGVLPTGVFLALGLVLPVLFCFYLAFGVLEHSGYLPRLSILLNKVFQKMGLNGKGVIPLVMGFSCVTMAILTTRMLDSKKEKNIATFLLLLGMPCAPLLAVMMIILNKMPLSASFMVFGMILAQILVAGYLANKIMTGKPKALIMELTPMRIPNMFDVLKSSLVKTWDFMKEAVPVFILASLFVFVFERMGGLTMLEKLTQPIIGGFMGLPEKSVQVFIKTIIRRESGATEIEHLAGVYTNLQMIVNLLVMTFLSPCINAAIVLFKERGAKAGGIIMATVFFYALAIGGVINHVCQFLGITFT